MAEHIEMLFALCTRVDPKKHVWHGVQCTLAQPGEYHWTVCVQWRCGLFVKLLWPLVIIKPHRSYYVHRCDRLLPTE